MEQQHTPLVAIISNPRSSTNRTALPAVRRVIDGHKNIIHFELDGAGKQDIRASLREGFALLRRAKPDLLVINGGDGTVGDVLALLFHEAALDTIPPIAILPGGQTNMTAKDLGAKGSPDQLLKNLLSIIQRGALSDHLTHRSLIEMDLNDGSAKKIGTFFGGAGCVRCIEWCRDYAQSLRLPAGLTYVVTIAHLILSAAGLSRHKDIFSPSQMKIHIFGSGHFSGSYSVMTVTTLNQVILGLKPYAKDQKGDLRTVMVGPKGGTILKAVWAMLFGRIGKKPVPEVEARGSDEIRLETTDPITLDGEIYSPTPGKPVVLRGGLRQTFFQF